MSYQTEFVVDFQSHRTGLTIYAQYYDNTGAASGSPITSGIVETASGIYRYLATISDGFVGSVVLYNSVNSDIRVAFSINPNELENTDVKTSTRASQISVDTIDSIVDNILLDTNELQSDWVNGGRLDLIIDAIKAVTDVLPDNGALTTLLNNVISILNDTNELQVDWQNGGRLDNILDSRASQTSVDNLNTLLLAGITVDSTTITNIAKAVLKLDASVIEDDLDAGQISLLTLVLGLLNSTLPEGGPWTIYKVGGGIYITRDIDEASAFTSVVGIHS